MAREKERGAKPTTGSLGTFAGVFTPSILTILGVILFLRLANVVGRGGMLLSLAVILLANVISALTTISLSAIATNLRVKGGGDYYLISRTLGVEYGGALGLVLFLAQSVSIGFYAIGFGEALTWTLGGPDWMPRFVAALAVVSLFVLAWLGADWATRFQYVVMAVLFGAIAGFFAGALPQWDGDVLQGNLAPASGAAESGTLWGFWVLFAIFFPAVTGFTQGVSMSGDLKDPGRSLPRGTFLAVGLSLLIYVTMAITLAASRPEEGLLNGYAMRELSVMPRLFDAGVFAATLSSALASFLGAPRILQSLAADRVFPILKSFAKGHGESNNPRRGVLLSLVIAVATVGMGELDLIAPVVSMFFLISYGLLNYATYVEARASSPYFRPRFRYFDKRLSLLGGLCCLGAMLAINPGAGVVAVALLLAIQQYISRTVRVSRWADSGRSQLFQRVRDDLHAISADMAHARDWRPVILAFSDDAERRARILRFARWIEGGSGFTTAVRLLEAAGPSWRKQQQQAEAELRQEIERLDLPAFAKVVVASDLGQALPTMLQSHGLGQVKANTILTNWADPADQVGLRRERYLTAMRNALRFGSNLVILSSSAEAVADIDETEPSKRTIDVWYRGNATGRLSLLLAYLMTRTEPWEDAAIRVFAPIRGGDDAEAELEQLRQMLDEVRIDAEPAVIENPGASQLIEYSGSSSMTFLPFRLGAEGPEATFEARLSELVRVLGVTAMVLATEDIELGAEPESGLHREIADAQDAAADSKAALQQAEKAAFKAETAAADARAALLEARGTQPGPDEIATLERAAKAAKEEAERAARKLAKARAKAELAAAAAAALTRKPGVAGEGDETT